MDEDKAYEVASADVVLPLREREATDIADALEMLAGIDDGEYTDTARLTQLAAIVRAAIVADMDGGTIEDDDDRRRAEEGDEQRDYAEERWQENAAREEAEAELEAERQEEASR